MKAYFDQDITARFYALKEDGCTPSEMDATGVNIYLFDKYPSLEEADTGNNSIQQITTWTNTPDSFGKEWVFTPIADPEPTSQNNTSYKYYYAVNATKAGNALSPIIREITLCRLRSQESILQCTIADIVACDPHITEFCHCLADLDLYIDCAIADIKAMMEGCCTTWADIVNPHELKRPLIYKTLSDFYFGQSRNVNDIWYSHAIRYKDTADKELKRVYLRLDKKQDGKPERI